ncbi:unnamed protein product [Rodentolepis nana]|uniref:Vacuolar protein sorting-associated protein 53 homolog n=1 Tax=Rodentolepis nana TaxID=102285 RepID=A0A0R3TS42_RODNA|nr:unnamed protein product [Rodentolepis nana]
MQHLYDAFSRVHSVCEDLLHPYRRLLSGILPTHISALLEYLQYFCQIRCKLLSLYALAICGILISKLIEIFPFLCSFSIVSNPDTDICSSAENFSAALEDTLALDVPVNSLQSAADPLIKIVRLEMEILAILFNLQCQLSNLEFLNSILSLQSLSIKLDKYSTRNDTVVEAPTPFMNWLRDFHSLLLAKFTLYWYTIFHPIATKSISMQHNLAKENPRIVLHVQEFVRKYEGSSVSIFFDAYLQDFDYLGHSYVPPGAAGMYVKSSVAIPCIFTYPLTESNAVPKNDYPVIMRALHSLLTVTTWKSPRQIVGQFEAQLGKTFFVQKLEKRYYMAVVVEDEHGALVENSHIRDFINRICDCTQIIDVARTLQSRS